MARPVEKRRHIERGVLQAVAERGLHAVTIQDIATAANVSPGLLYRYWKGRDELAAEVYCSIHHALLDRLNHLSAGHADPWDKLRVAVRGFLEFAERQPVELKFLLLSQHDLATHLPLDLTFHVWLRRVLGEGMAQGRVRRMPIDLAADLALGVVVQPLVGALYGRIQVPPRKLFDELFAALQRVLGAAPRAPKTGRKSVRKTLARAAARG